MNLIGIQKMSNSLKTLPSQLSYEELIEAMEDAPEETGEVLEHVEDVVPFLSHYNVTPGDHPVSKRLLYKLYRTYSKNPVPQTQFIYHVQEFVASRVLGGRSFFCLNQDNFAISKAIFKEQKTIEKTKSLTYQKHFKWFMDGRGVSPGKRWVEGFVLYFIYKDFCRQKRMKPKLGYENYHKFLKLHFKYKRLKENRALWFAVNQETHDAMSEEEKNVIREARKKTGRTKKKTKSETDQSPEE